MHHASLFCHGDQTLRAFFLAAIVSVREALYRVGAAKDLSSLAACSTS